MAAAKVTGAVRPIHPSPLQTQCVAESLRGKQDWVNGSLAGLATGGVLGIRSESADEMLLPCRYVVCPLWLGSAGRWAPVTRCSFLRHGTRLIDILLTPRHTHSCHTVGRIPVGIAAGAVLAFTSAMVDVSGQKLRSDGYVDDGATTGRTVYPYDA